MKNSKYENLSSKQTLNTNKINSKPFNLEERTLQFSKDIIRLCKSLPTNYINRILGNQCLRSATSIGANYREANETDTKKDFKNRIRISKKEAKETIYWLKLLIEANGIIENNIIPYVNESNELMKIMGSIYEKAK